MQRTQVGPDAATLVSDGSTPYMLIIVHRMLQEATMPHTVSRNSVRDPGAAMTLAQSDILAPVVFAVASFLMYAIGRVVRLVAR